MTTPQSPSGSLTLGRLGLPLRPGRPAILALLVLAPVLALPGATPLLDFEDEADLASLRWASRGESQLQRDGLFASSGSWALRFTSPAWKSGFPEWPAFEFKPALTNWTDYDRLSVDIVNPGPERHVFALFISDAKVPFREGLSYTFKLPARGFRRFEIPLSAFPASVNRRAIAIVHLFTERPRANLELHLDRLILLKKGETSPEPPPALLGRAARLTLEEVAATQAALAGARKTNGLGNLPGLDAPLERELQSLRDGLEPNQPTLARLEQAAEALEGFPQKVRRAASIGRWHEACARAGRPGAAMLVGFATSMEKLLPREMPIEVRAEAPAEISLARNEKESFQVAVLAPSQPLKNVRVTVSDLTSAGGARLRSGQVRCEVMGYVRTQARPPYGTSHIGWWPDPILDFLGPVEVAPGDLQAFWVRVHAPGHQPPGLYQGRLEVLADGLPAQEFDLRVRVRSFALPGHSPLPLAITFSPEDNALDSTGAQQAEWRKAPDYPVNAWRKHKLRWADMLADYYISYDSLYHRGLPDFEVLSHLRGQGRLGAFNLGYYGPVGAKPGDLDQWKADTLPRLRQAYARARELNLLDHAYIYGCDEAPKDLFPGVQQAAALLKAEFPGVLISTTTYDHSYGQDSVIKALDWFCPLTPSFEPAKAAAARAAGRQVWWYICCGPHHPHANMFIEYPAIEGRLLMGAMTARQRPDGFLYYQISIWNSRRPITAGPFTDWDPRSWTTYHGDGSWTCVGPDGAPLPTLRLENFRDGLEDYAYAVILEEMIRRREGAGASLSAAEREWLAEARAALPVPEALVKSMKDYSRDPAVLYAWRNRMGDLLDRAGAEAVNPWGADFGVRGLPRQKAR